MIRAILAHDSYWGIGADGTLPWPKNKEDMKWFKEMTMNHTVVMGRKTWDSLPVKPLPNRHNIIITSSEIDPTVVKDHRNSSYIDHSRESIGLLSSVSNLKSLKGDMWIIGGATLIESSLDIIDELWLNDVGGEYPCDIYLPRTKIKKMFTPSEPDVRSFGTITKWKLNEKLS